MNHNTLPQSTREDIADELNELIAICIDGEKGFHDAADDTKNPELKTLFTRLSRQRADFGTDLKRLVHAFGCEPRDSSHISGKIHRGWINLKSAIVKNDAHAVLAECERGEDEAVEAYQEALKSDKFTADIRAIIASQAELVQAAHDQIRDLRDHPAYASN